jgi:hypothetical protein
LRAKGLVFSDVPTEEETAAAESAYNLKRDLDGIDPSLIISDSRKRPSSGGAAEAGKERDREGQHAPSAKAPKPAAATAGGSSAAAGLVAVKAEGAEAAGGKVKSPPSAGGPAAVKRQRVVEYSDEEAEF